MSVGERGGPSHRSSASVTGDILYLDTQRRLFNHVFVMITSLIRMMSYLSDLFIFSITFAVASTLGYSHADRL